MTCLGGAFLQLLYTRLEQRASEFVLLQQIVRSVCRSDGEPKELCRSFGQTSCILTGALRIAHEAEEPKRTIAMFGVSTTDTRKDSVIATAQLTLLGTHQLVA